MSELRLIKKYANRRLYDTVASGHITLDGVRELIIAGHDVKIVDETTGDDITRNLLLQIIADQEQGGRPMLDAEFLMRIIRLYGNPIQDLMGKYLRKSFDAFMTQQTQLQERMRAAMAAAPLATLQSMTEANMKAWQTFQDTILGKQGNKKDDSER